MPTKAMVDDPALEFEHYLAAHLGMTVERLRREMPAAEFTSWQIYYARKAQREQLAAMRGGGG